MTQQWKDLSPRVRSRKKRQLREVFTMQHRVLDEFIKDRFIDVFQRRRQLPLQQQQQQQQTSTQFRQTTTTALPFPNEYKELFAYFIKYDKDIRRPFRDKDAIDAYVQSGAIDLITLFILADYYGITWYVVRQMHLTPIVIYPRKNAKFLPFEDHYKHHHVVSLYMTRATGTQPGYQFYEIYPRTTSVLHHRYTTPLMRARNAHSFNESVAYYNSVALHDDSQLKQSFLEHERVPEIMEIQDFYKNITPHFKPTKDEKKVIALNAKYDPRLALEIYTDLERFYNSYFGPKPELFRPHKYKKLE